MDSCLESYMDSCLDSYMDSLYSSLDNYIYLKVAGFTEHDTFRSNQIRENLITREQALNLVENENILRAESFKWYCDVINIDAVNALKVINEIPTYYR